MPHALGDKRCPDCQQHTVYWKPIAVAAKNEKAVEVGRFVCYFCGWSSELHEVVIE